MHLHATAPSRFAVWRSLEHPSDQLASMGALGIGLVALGAFAAFAAL
jgi:hypothetical protein